MQNNHKRSPRFVIKFTQCIGLLCCLTVLSNAIAAQTLATRIQPEIVFAGDLNQPSTTTWAELVDGFSLPTLPASVLRPVEQWLLEHPTFLNQVMSRAPLYLPYVLRQVKAQGLPTELALLPAIESAYDPLAVSRANAVGMWQFIAKTGRRYKLEQNSWVDERRNIVKSTRAALEYLKFLHDDFDGDWHKAISAYNYGEDRLHRAEKRNAAKGLSQALNKLRLPRETRRYVPQLLALANLIRRADKFGLKLPANASPDVPEVVVLHGQYDLPRVARFARLSIDDFYRFNPAFNRRSSAPDKRHYLLLPANSARHLLFAQQRHPDLFNAMQMTRYSTVAVRRGDSVLKFAHRLGIKTADILTSNPSLNKHLQPGQQLRIPESLRPFATIDGIAKVTGANASVTKRTRHKVRYGETLSHIAMKYRVVIADLAKWNNMRLSDPLLAGRLLTVSRRLH